MNELALKRAELIQANLWRINLVGFWTIVWIQIRTTRRDSLRTIVQKPTRLMRQRLNRTTSARLIASSFMPNASPACPRAG